MICEERKTLLLRILDAKPLKDVVWVTQMAMTIFARGQTVANIPMEKHLAKGTFAFYLNDMDAIYEEIDRRLAILGEFSYRVILHEHTWIEWYRDVKGCAKIIAEQTHATRKGVYESWCQGYESGGAKITEEARAQYVIKVSQLNYPN